jgi:23S rRNA pseudouridine1911/1915/1917 synthase
MDAMQRDSEVWWTVEAGEAGARLDKYLADPARLCSRGKASDALARGQVFVNALEVGADDASRTVKRGDRVRVWRDRPGSAKRRSLSRDAGPLRLVYEDEALAVIDKPPGLLSVPLAGDPGDSVASLLPLCWKGPRHAAAFVVHRLDRDTSGLVVFAKSTAACQALKTQFITHTAVREYLTIVHGVPEPAEDEWRDIMRWNPTTRKSEVLAAMEHGALEARLKYRVAEDLNEAAVLDVALITGRRNQIRVQAAWRGHPVFGERQYARMHDPIGRQALHAVRLSFAHPIDGRPMRLESPWPADMRQLVRSLRREAE